MSSAEYISPQELLERKQLNTLSRNMAEVTRIMRLQEKMLKKAVNELIFLSRCDSMHPALKVHISVCLEEIHNTGNQ